MKRRKKNLPLISVVILNYNGLKFLIKTIPPLLELNYPNYEIIIVDNYSQDDSVDYIERIKKQSKLGFQLIKNQGNYGCSMGKNIGVRNAKGNYILMLDSDILIDDKNILNKLYSEYQSINRIALLGIVVLQKNHNKTSYGRFYDLLNHLQIEHPKFEIGKFINLKKPLKIGYASGGAFFFNRNVWFKLGEYDESQPFNIDDFDIGARAYIMGYGNYLATNTVSIHLDTRRAENISSWCWKYKYFFSGKSRAILKNYSFLNVLKFFPIFVLSSLIKTFKQSIKKGHIVWKCYFYSIIYFLNKLPDTLKHRREIQSRRKNKDDKFLKISPPKFNCTDQSYLT